MPGEFDTDRQLLKGILGYCLAKHYAMPYTWPMPPETLARRRAYEEVALAARELLEEIDA